MQNLYLSQDQILSNIEFFKQNSEKEYSECIQDLINQRPFGDHKFYIFSFVKRVDDSTGVKVMYHQPRLTKPEPLPGTTLLRVDPKYPEEAIIVWTLPNQENFGLYKEGKMFADSFVYECIEKFLKNPRDLMERMEGDLPDEKIREIYCDLKRKAIEKKNAKKAEKVQKVKAVKDIIG